MRPETVTVLVNRITGKFGFRLVGHDIREIKSLTVANSIEACPLCGQTSGVRPKLVLIDEAWIPAPGKDSRLAYFADLRADDVRPENLHQPPLEQFIEGFYCDRCNNGFVSEEILKPTRRRY